MALPKIDSPIFVAELPSNNQKVKYRPFLVKEEKILLMALEGNDEEEITRAIRQVITNCCLEDDFNIDIIPMFDLEYLFLQLRGKSIGENISLQFKCEKCEYLIPVEIDLSKIKLKKKKEHTNKFQLNSQIGIVMRYPTLDMGNMMLSLEENVDSVFKVITSCVDYIYDKETIYSHTDTPQNEIEAWLMELTQDQFSKIRDFFDTMPKLSHKVELVCSKCEHKETKLLEGLNNFFE